MSALINEFKNGSLGGTSPDSSYYFVASGSSSRTYEVTINSTTGHWCSCKGNVSKLGAAERRHVTRNPALHSAWCKHVQEVLKNQVLLADGVANRAEQIKETNEVAADELPALVLVTA
jgi:hypothetical protein